MIQAIAAQGSDHRTTYAFCQGDFGDIGWSRIPINRAGGAAITGIHLAPRGSGAIATGAISSSVLDSSC
jgi:hypothetical protein